MPGFSGFFLTIFFMIFIAAAFVNLGLSIASLMRDMQGFSIVMNFIMVPLLLLSGAMFPVEQFPAWVRALCYINPLFYGVDGLRYSLIGMSKFSPLIDAAVLFFFCAVMVSLGAFLFSRSDVD
jgi:ABC-2 type transport system permease protein